MSAMAEDDIRLSTDEHLDAFVDSHSPGRWGQQGYHSTAKVETCFERRLEPACLTKS